MVLSQNQKILIGKVNRFLTVITIAVIAYSLFEALGTFLVTRDFAAYVFLFPYTAIRCASVFIWSILFFFYFSKFKFRSGAMFIFLFGIDNSQYTILSGTFFHGGILWASINTAYLSMIPFGAFFLWKFSVKINLVSIATLAGYATIEGIYYSLFYYNPLLDFTGVLLVPIVFYNAIEPKYEDNIYYRLPKKNSRLTQNAIHNSERENSKNI